MREGYSTVSIEVWGYVEPLPDEQKLTERSEDYVILPKEELHLKWQKGTEPECWYLDQNEGLGRRRKWSRLDREENDIL